MKAGWEVRNLGDLCEMYQPKTLTKKELAENGQYPVFGANGIMGWHDQFNHAASELLIGCRGACGTVHISSPNSWITGNSMVVRPRSGCISREFLRYFFLGPANLNEVVTGAAQPQITQASLKPITVPIPPLDEQKRIVAALDEAFEGLSRARANAEANLADADGLWASSLATTFAALAEKAQLVELPAVVTDDCKLSYGIVQPGDETDAGLPIVRPIDLKGDTVGLTGLKRINPTHAQGYERTELQGGELLLCVRGTTGTVSIADAKLLGANVTRGIVPIRFRADKINPRFAFFQFISPNVQDQIRAKTYGAALMQINIGDLRKLTLILPSQEEQVAACQKLEGIRANYAELAHLQTKQIDAIEALRQSLLQKAFSGELT